MKKLIALLLLIALFGSAVASPWGGASLLATGSTQAPGIFFIWSQSSGGSQTGTSNAVTWTTRSTVANCVGVTSIGGSHAIAWNGTLFTAAGYNSTAGCSSPDAITWTSRTMPSASFWKAMAWNGSIFCAISTTSDAAKSSNGTSWTAETGPLATNAQDLIWNGTQFLLVGAGTATTYTSSDCISWTTHASAFPSSEIWNYVKWSGTQYVAINRSGNSYTSATSPDGINWTGFSSLPNQAWNGLSFNGTTYCAVDSDQTGFDAASSSDGATWTPRMIGASDTWQSVNWNGALFVAVGSTNGIIKSSPDCITWTTRTAAGSGAMTAVVSKWLQFGTY